MEPRVRGEARTADETRDLYDRWAETCDTEPIGENGAAGNADGFITLASSGPAPLLDPAGAPAQGAEIGDGGPELPRGGAGAHLATASRSFLSPWSLVGGPSLSLPWMGVDGLPQGLQLMGGTDTDFKLVGIARWADGD